MGTMILRGVGGAIAAAALLVVGAAWAGRTARPAQPAQAMRIYEGVSNKGKLQEALDDAVSRALKALPGADRMVRYRVREITGEQGGIRGGSTLRVSIEVTGPE